MTLDEVPWRSVLAAGETAWVVGLVVFIVLERRPPVSTLAWIFGLVLLPFLGLPVYFLFGPRRLRRRKLRYRDKRVAVTHALANAHERMPTPYATRLAGIGEKLQHTHVSTATRVELFYEGDDAYDAILGAIERANDHVHVEYYIFESDEVGAKLRDALTAAAKRGVEVRLLVDAVGSSGAGRRFFDDVTRAGGQVRRFQPPRLGLARARFFNFRTHRKIVVIDGRVGFTGGVNWAACHSARASGPSAWRDTHVELEGPVVASLQRTFLENWVYSKGDSATTRRYFPELAEGAELVQILRSGPDRDVFPIHAFYFSAIATARERVLLTTPYLVPDEAALAALKSAVLRGVRVEILVPREGDSRIVQAASRSYYEELLDAGCILHEYEPRMLHAKTLVIDSEVATVGTANFDNRSFRLNFEVMAVLYGARHADALAGQFARDVASARLVGRRKLRELGALQRLGEASARLASPLL
jgi:cardiolipin synthase